MHNLGNKIKWRFNDRKVVYFFKEPQGSFFLKGGETKWRKHANVI